MADFQSNNELQALNIRVIAASVDTPDQAAAVVEELGLTNIDMASGVDGLAAAEILGAYIDTANAPYLQPTAFIVNPDGNVVQSLYSSNALGRLSPTDVVTMVKMHTGR